MWINTWSLPCTPPSRGIQLTCRCVGCEAEHHVEELKCPKQSQVPEAQALLHSGKALPTAVNSISVDLRTGVDS